MIRKSRLKTYNLMLKANKVRYKKALLNDNRNTIGCGDWFKTSSKRHARARAYHS